MTPLAPPLRVLVKLNAREAAKHLAKKISSSLGALFSVLWEIQKTEESSIRCILSPGSDTNV